MNTCETDNINICAIDKDLDGNTMGSEESHQIYFDVNPTNDNVSLTVSSLPHIDILEDAALDISGNDYCGISLDQYFEDIDESYGCPLQKIGYTISDYCGLGNGDANSNVLLFDSPPSINSNITNIQQNLQFHKTNIKSIVRENSWFDFQARN